MKKYLIFIISVIFLIFILSSCFFIQKPTLEAPILLMPPNGTITSTNVTLSWKEPGYSQSLEYKIFFGTDANPQYVTTVQSTSFAENDLAYSTKYYWQIVAFDQSGQSATSAVWSFTTESAPLPTVTNWATMGPYNIPNSFKNVSVDSGNFAAGKVNAFAVDLQNPQIMYRGGGAGPGNSGPYSESGLYKSTDGGNQWFQIDNGLTDPMIDSIWIDQSNPQILLVGTWLTGIFRSTDGGNSWSLVYNSQTANFYESGSNLYAATAQGVLLSQDDGQTWTLAEPTPNPVRVITGGNGVLYAGLDNGNIMAQYGNSSWQTVYAPSQSTWHTVWSIAVDPYSTTTVYAVEWQGYNYPDLIFTNDGGKDWNNSTMNYRPIQYVAFDVNTQGVIYAGADGSLYRSDDNGNTWNEITQTGDTRLLYSWPGRPNTIVAGTDQGLYISYNSGQSWTSLNGEVTSSLLTSFAMNGSSIFTAVQDFSPIVTFNGGQSWNQLYGTNPPVGEDGTFKINPGNPNYVYAFTTVGFQYSQDGGNTFYSAQGLPNNPLTFSGNNNLIAVNPNNSSVVYVATKNGVYESANWGVSWQAESSWPSNPSLVFVSQNGTIYVGSSAGLFVSQDGGNTWAQSNLGGSSGYPVSIDVDPANNQIVLLGMSTGPDQGGGLLKSTDGGLNFTRSNSGINMANNWEWNAVQGLAMWSVKFDPQDPAIVALGTAGGIFLSYNYGNTWISIKNNAIPNLYTDLAWSGNYLYASSYGEGILRLSVNIP